MNLPRLIPVTNLPFTLPPIKNNQTWALNQDTTPPSLVLIEFVYSSVDTVVETASQSSVNLLNTSINQSLSSLSTELSNVSARLTTLESLIGTSNFVASPTALTIEPAQ